MPRSYRSVPGDKRAGKDAGAPRLRVAQAIVFLRAADGVGDDVVRPVDDGRWRSRVPNRGVQVRVGFEGEVRYSRRPGEDDVCRVDKLDLQDRQTDKLGQHHVVTDRKSTRL